MNRAFGLKQNITTKIRNTNVSFQTRLEKIEKKVEGTFAENWFRFWKNIVTDYKEVFVDLGKEVKSKPLKAVAVASTFGLLAFLHRNNPDEANYRAAIVSASNDMAVVPSSLQKIEATKHLRFVEQCYNQNVVRRLNLGIASIIWIDDHNTEYKNFETECEYFHIPYFEFQSRILDYGFLNTWWVLDEKMEDYDINF